MGTKPRNVLKSLRVKDFLTVDGAISSEMNSPKRYTVSANFSPKPGIAADTAYTFDTETMVAGTNMTSALVTYNATTGGIRMTTAGADNDQAILSGHTTGTLSAMKNTAWGTENETIFEASIRTGDDITTGVLLWAGLKLTNTPTVATDADQVFFRFSTDDSDTYWELVSSNTNVDTTTASTVAVAANTEYRFKIVIDSARKATFFINDAVVGTTAALKNDISLLPFIGIQALSAAAEFVTVHSLKMSRLNYE